jgi:anaerobic selenocysteine-containing dehydrogenase
VDEYYSFIFEHSVPGLPERAAADGMTPLAWMRRYGAFEIARGVGPLHEQEVPAAELEDVAVSELGRAYSRTPKPDSPNLVPLPTVDPDEHGRRPVGVQVDGVIRRGWPTPSGRLEFYSRTLADWGWAEAALPTYTRSHVHPDELAPDQLVLISTFRVPVQIHTRSANAKWLDEIAHTNPLWVHPRDATRIGVGTGDLVRVETEIGHFVLKAWVTEGIRPGVVACSHHMGRWKPERENGGQRQAMATVALSRRGHDWRLRRTAGVAPFASADPDTRRIWWSDVGVHQNLTFAVHPDPVSGMHCWHQAVRVRRAEPADAHGDIAVDTAAARAVYQRWLAAARPARDVSPDGNRRPYWLLRPLKPGLDAYRLPALQQP